MCRVDFFFKSKLWWRKGPWSSDTVRYTGTGTVINLCDKIYISSAQLTKPIQIGGSYNAEKSAQAQPTYNH